MNSKIIVKLNTTINNQSIIQSISKYIKNEIND